MESGKGWFEQGGIEGIVMDAPEDKVVFALGDVEASTASWVACCEGDVVGEGAVSFGDEGNESSCRSVEDSGV